MSEPNAIQHIVLYSVAKPEALESAVQYIKALEQQATRNGKPYIQSIRCGTTRPSGKVRSQGNPSLDEIHGKPGNTMTKADQRTTVGFGSTGFNLASFITFASDEDRLYFVKEDPAHKELIAFINDKLGKEIMVLDFVDGVADNSVRVDQC
ncbi:hypothetical protein LTR67_009067 [Exophiala xenobiotica]